MKYELILKFIIDTKHPDVVTQVRIEKSKVGEKDTIWKEKF